MQHQEHPTHPGFYVIRIPFSEWINPPEDRMGERVIDSEGRVIAFPAAHCDEVMVLRRLPDRATCARLMLPEGIDGRGRGQRLEAFGPDTALFRTRTKKPPV